MTTGVLLAVLAAAMLHAAWNAMAKGRGSTDPLVGTLILGIGCGVVALPVLVVSGLPATASYPYVVASGLIHILYFVLVGLSYRVADYSAVYPLMRGSAPLLTTLAGGVWLAEPLTPQILGGVTLLSCGVLGLGSNALRRGGLNGRGLLIAGTNILVIVLYTLTDGLGGRLSGNPLGYVAAMLLVTAIFLVPMALYVRGRQIAADMATNWHIGLLGGTMALTSYAVALWAMTRAPIGAVAALRETSVLFGTLIAVVALKERFGVGRWAAALAICTGLVLIRLA